MIFSNIFVWNCLFLLVLSLFQSNTTGSSASIGNIYVCGSIKRLHLTSPTCSLYGEVGITQGMMECHLNFAFFNKYGVPIYYQATPFIDIQVNWALLLLISLLRGHKFRIRHVHHYDETGHIFVFFAHVSLIICLLYFCK